MEFFEVRLKYSSNTEIVLGVVTEEFYNKNLNSLMKLASDEGAELVESLVHVSRTVVADLLKKDYTPTERTSFGTSWDLLMPAVKKVGTLSRLRNVPHNIKEEYFFDNKVMEACDWVIEFILRLDFLDKIRTQFPSSIEFKKI